MRIVARNNELTSVEVALVIFERLTWPQPCEQRFQVEIEHSVERLNSTNAIAHKLN